MARGRRTTPDAGLKTRVKSAKGRRISSTLWLERQLNDPYVKRARAEGYRSRAAYKLVELDRRFGLLQPGMRIVDLGCAPGGWLQVATRAVGATHDDPSVVGIDCLDTGPVPGAIILKKDFSDADAPEALIAALAGRKADLVLSDMAPPTTGHKPTDHLRIVALVELAAEFMHDVLAPGGSFVAKVLQGGTEHELLAGLKRDFASVSHAKPPASRSDSAETYLVARGFRGSDGP